MAKYHTQFRARLLEDRAAALAETDLQFSAGEQLLLQGITDLQLAQTIEEFTVPGVTRKSLPSWIRGAAVVALLSSVLFAELACSGDVTTDPMIERGSLPDSVQTSPPKEVAAQGWTTRRTNEIKPEMIEPK
jgi:hypothetical protein